MAFAEAPRWRELGPAGGSRGARVAGAERGRERGGLAGTGPQPLWPGGRTLGVSLCMGETADGF